MTHEEKRAIARTGDTSTRAMQVRFAAVMAAIGMSKKAMADAIGITPPAITNMASKAATNRPSDDAMFVLYDRMKIEPKFIMFGELAGLPPAIEDAVLAEISALERTWAT